MGKERKKEEEIKATDHLFRTHPSYFHVNEALPKEHQAFKTTVFWVFRGMGKRWNPLHNAKNPHTYCLTGHNEVTKNSTHYNDKGLENAQVAVKASCYAFRQNVDW